MVDEIINAFYDSEHHYGYDCVYTVDNAPQNDDEFKLHNHSDRYEIVLFLTGNAEFHIEGNIYQSHPHDIYIARPMEMHHNCFLSPERYSRVVIHIPLNFLRTTTAQSWNVYSWTGRPVQTARSRPGSLTGRCIICS